MWDRRIGYRAKTSRWLRHDDHPRALWAPAENGQLGLRIRRVHGLAEGGVKGADRVAVVRAVSSRSDIIISAYERY